MVAMWIVLVADLLADDLLRLEGILAPEVGGIPDLDLVVVDPEVDGLLGLALDDQAVVAGELQLGTPVPAEDAVEEGAGLGGLGANAWQRDAAGIIVPLTGPVMKISLFSGPRGSIFGGHLVVEEAGRIAHAAHEIPRPILAQRLPGDRCSRSGSPAVVVRCSRHT